VNDESLKVGLSLLLTRAKTAADFIAPFIRTHALQTFPG